MLELDLTYEQPTTHNVSTVEYRDLNRLLSAAIVSTGFRNMLITNPEMAIAKGYQGEKFDLTSEEYRWLISIQAIDLAGFASQLLEFQNTRTHANDLAIAVKIPAMSHVS